MAALSPQALPTRDALAEFARRQRADGGRPGTRAGDSGGSCTITVSPYTRQRDGKSEQVSGYQRSNPNCGADVGYEASVRPVSSRVPERASAPTRFVAPPLTPTPPRAWEDQPNAAFRAAIAERERSAQRPDHGYGDRREDWGALGRYQFRNSGLRGAGWLDAEGRWTSRALAAGVSSRESFLANPRAQEQAFTDYLADNERQLRALSVWQRIASEVRVSNTDRVPVTAAGLMAAAHGQGPGAVRTFFRELDGGSLPQSGAGRAVLSRVRAFSSVPYDSSSR